MATAYYNDAIFLSGRLDAILLSSFRVCIVSESTRPHSPKVRIAINFFSCVEGRGQCIRGPKDVCHGDQNSFGLDTSRGGLAD
jgi:hypothetical protein